jgi:hypothetical protein
MAPKIFPSKVDLVGLSNVTVRYDMYTTDLKEGSTEKANIKRVILFTFSL